MSVLDTFSLKGKVALVTGGAGLYGRQILAALAEAGAQTYVASRNVEALETVAAEHRQQGHDVTALPFNQAEESSSYELRDAILKRSGRIDVLVNNAVSRPMKEGFRSDASTFAESMQTNATGLFIVTRAFGDAMTEPSRGEPGGSIINIGSIHGMIGPDATLYTDTGLSGWYPDYFFHKGGMINFTRFIASYYGPHNIRCNCVSAGGFLYNQPEKFLDRYCDRTFLGRMANDSDLQGVIVFLASDASQYVTGANIAVDGGYTAK
jgi:NAD(P)-dependent dehydrogenase (short-subunit alcohol dehydrogenase family)